MASALVIGGNPDPSLGGGGGRKWNGQIDDLAVWGRALSPSEIQTIWNNGSGASFGALIRPGVTIRDIIHNRANGEITLSWITLPTERYAMVPASFYSIQWSTDLSNWNQGALVLASGEAIQSRVLVPPPGIPPAAVFYRIEKQYLLFDQSLF